VSAPNTPTPGSLAAEAAEDRELEAWEARVAARPARRIRVAGALAGGAAFIGALAVSPPNRGAGAWTLAVLALAAVIAICHVAVRIAARPGRPEPGRLTADYLVIFSGAIAFAIVGYPAAAAVGLLKDAF
jgi:hypothetical protein